MSDLLEKIKRHSAKSLFRAVIDRALLGGKSKNYRETLFEELCAYSGGKRFQKILEIGPRDGLDSKRLLTLVPEELSLIDLKNKPPVSR